MCYSSHWSVTLEGVDGGVANDSGAGLHMRDHQAREGEDAQDVGFERGADLLVAELEEVGLVGCSTYEGSWESQDAHFECLRC